jgi:hypothetical protein
VLSIHQGRADKNSGYVTEFLIQSANPHREMRRKWQNGPEAFNMLHSQKNPFWQVAYLDFVKV